MQDYGMIHKPWAHQLPAIELVKRYAAAGLWMDMGTGKTPVIVSEIATAGHKRVLILCPKSVIPVWPAEFVKHSKNPPLVATLGKGTMKRKAEELEEVLVMAGDRQLVVVINYESAWWESPKRGHKCKRPLGALLMRTKWDMVVCDEIHRIKGHGSKISKFCYRLGLNTPKRVGLSGTPTPHSPLDAFGVYRFLDCRIFGVYWTPFKSMYAQTWGPHNSWIKGYKNLEHLTEKMRSIAYVCKAADVLDLPEQLDIWRWMDLCPKAQKIYTSLEKELIAELDVGEITAANALVKLLRLQQITGGLVTLDEDDTGERQHIEIDTGKEELLREILDDLPMDEPVVVFCKFKHDIEVVRRVATRVTRLKEKEQARECLELSGRVHEWEEFQKERSGGEVLAVQIRSGGVGIDLTRAHYAVYYSTGFDLGDVLQSRARLHRPGQERTVFYYHLGAEGTIDRAIAKALEKRQNLVESCIKSVRGIKDD